MASKLVDDFATKMYLNNLYSESMEGEDDWEMSRVVRMLMSSFPQSANIPSDNIEWYTPLEYATRNLPSGHDREEILSILKRTHETSFSGISWVSSITCDDSSLSSSWSDSKGSSDFKVFPISNCPLLYTYISNEQWQRSIDRVTESPEEASYWVIDADYPRLPIHLACTKSAPRDVIQALMSAYPEGCMAKEGSGSNPLHVACQNALPVESVTLLVDEYPKAARIKDEHGRFPLHVACANGADVEIVKALIDAYPASCSLKALAYIDHCTEIRIMKEIKFLSL